MTHEKDSYNLLEEAWIPVLRNNGVTQRLGVLEVLNQAHLIRQIASSNPMDRVAILRFLLSILYWGRGNPQDYDHQDINGPFPGEWFEILARHHDCFNLLGSSKRFLQVDPTASGKPEPRYVTANYLIHEIPTGSNYIHFRHSCDRASGLCPACCAMGLIRLPVFATSGGRGKPPGINSKPPCYLIPVGKNLAATLRLSWRPATCIGSPFWQDPGFDKPLDTEVTMLTGMTWAPRKVWLGEPDREKKVCISCGDNTYLIRSCVFDGIGSQKTEEDGPQRQWKDPHVLYVEQGTKTKTLISLGERDALGSTDATAGQWKSLVAGLRLDDRSLEWVNHLVTSHRVDPREIHYLGAGFSTVKNDKYLETREYRIALADLAAYGFQNSGEFIDLWDEELRKMPKKLVNRAIGNLARSEIEGKIAMAAVRPHLENNLSDYMGELISGGEKGWSQAMAQYRFMMRAVSRSYSPGVTTDAVERRVQIGRLKPDLNPKESPKNKQVVEGGGI